MKYVAANEIITGLVLSGDLSAGTIDPALLIEPYAGIVEKKKHGAKLPALIAQFGLGPIETAQAAAASLDGQPHGDWLEVLTQLKTFEEVATRFDVFSRKLHQGVAIDEVEALGEVRRLSTLEANVTTLDKITEDPIHFQPLYWGPVDDTWGGVPDAGVLTVAGLPKTGKSRLAMKAVAYKAMHEEHCLVFSLEMPGDEWKSALLDVVPQLRRPKWKKAMQYIHVYTGDEALSADRMVAISIQNATQYKLRLIVGDVAEMLLDRSPDEPSMTYLWKQMSSLSRRIRVCFLATAQFNDGAYQGGIPLSRHIRYGRMVVAYSSMIWCIYNPAMTWTTKQSDTRLPIFNGHSYIINWISRWGFGKQGSGAIRVSWNGKQGWGDQLEGYHPIAEIME